VSVSVRINLYLCDCVPVYQYVCTNVWVYQCVGGVRVVVWGGVRVVVGGGGEDLQQDTLKRVELLNCATMFWPTWYAALLPEDWWSNAPAVSCKITSWVVKDDPLSEGLQGSGGFRAVCVCVCL
jgi:hypothetical protein